MGRVECLCALLLASSVESFRGPGLWPHRTGSMRSRYALAAMSENEGDATGGLAGLFRINRNTPEAKANQLKWAREQMDLEMPTNTLEGTEIDDREVGQIRLQEHGLQRPPDMPSRALQDFILKYIESEKAKFGREVTREVAEQEVDAWLLK